MASDALQKFEALVQLTKLSWQLQMPKPVSQGGGTATHPTAASGQGLWPALPQTGFSNTDDLDWSSFDVEYDNTNAWPIELQEVPDWFSLADWLNEDGSTTLG